MAKDKELNRWNSLKKAVQYRPEHVEKYDVIAFRKKAQNEHLKRKFIPSLFTSAEEEEPTHPTTSESTSYENVTEKADENEDLIEKGISNGQDTKMEKKKRKKEKNKEKGQWETVNEDNTNDYLKEESAIIKTKKIKKRKAEVDCNDVLNDINTTEQNHSKLKQKHIAKKKNNNKQTSKFDIGLTDARLEAYGINPKKYKNKLKYGNKK